MRTLCKAVTGLYVVLCIGALALIPLNAAGMAGEPDPVTGIFAVLLAVPWIWLTGPITSDIGIAWNLIVVGACMALNALILWKLCGWLAAKTFARPSI